ncbi:MAG: toxin-antitoxin system Txe/YoeB family toxin component [Algoriphagus marincola HL-49]|uniref:Toxin-antitoxin system Txe/YoeB family toxin component n=1 Tax=Algoriphagus marincola HL-49 TaxID=1305737 RepID=A0A0N8KHH0_9BACT|nr:MAG: toxin-antitoxin system Txe/YoeB family toxin component [Algoriphagus marincola HL-49]
MRVVWTGTAWEVYLYWRTIDKKNFKRIITSEFEKGPVFLR